jgi:hypothetical protein
MTPDGEIAALKERLASAQAAVAATRRDLGAVEGSQTQELLALTQSAMAGGTRRV